MTVTVVVIEQPVTGSIYTIVAEPDMPEVTTPVDELIEATPVASDDQLPVVGELLSVVVKPPSHTASGPVIVLGSGFTVTTALPVNVRLQLPSVALVSA